MHSEYKHTSNGTVPRVWLIVKNTGGQHVTNGWFAHVLVC